MPNARLDRLTHRHALAALLSAYGVDVNVLTGASAASKTRKDEEGRHAARILYELAEGVHPGPMHEFVAMTGLVRIA